MLYWKKIISVILNFLLLVKLKAIIEYQQLKDFIAPLSSVKAD